MHDDTGDLSGPDPRHHAPPHPDTAVDRVLDFIAWLCMLVAGIALVVIIVTFGWLVYGRYILDNTPTWVEQLSLLLIAYITFLGAAVGVRRNTHLSIDFVREGLPALPREVMRYIADIMVFVFGVFMAWQGWNLILANTERPIPMLDIPESWRAAPIFICGVLVVVFSGSNIITRALGRSTDAR